MPLLPLTQNQQLGYAEHAIPKMASFDIHAPGHLANRGARCKSLRDENRAPVPKIV
jgi:hypothetical protein